jgi:hypothetical protein
MNWRMFLVGVVAALGFTPDCASAQTVAGATAYQYDALGRLTNVYHTDGANDGVATKYSYDAASNRRNATTALPTGWSVCSGQNQACVMFGDPGQIWLVRYGADPNWSSPMMITLSGTYAAIGCQDSVFGDPYPGVGKHCEVKRTNPTSWSVCSQQNQACAVYGDPGQIWQVRYGSDPNWSSYSTFTLSGNYAAFGCQDLVFGDPYPGVAKHCEARRLP